MMSAALSTRAADACVQFNAAVDIPPEREPPRSTWDEEHDVLVMLSIFLFVIIFFAVIVGVASVTDTRSEHLNSGSMAIVILSVLAIIFALVFGFHLAEFEWMKDVSIIQWMRGVVPTASSSVVVVSPLHAANVKGSDAVDDRRPPVDDGAVAALATRGKNISAAGV